MLCRNHPGTETSVRCGKCGDPVCSKCSVMRAGGIWCRDCAKRLRAANAPDWRDIGIAGLGGAGAAALAGLALFWLRDIGIFVLAIGLAAGQGVGIVVLRLSGESRGTATEAVAGTSAILGMWAGWSLGSAGAQSPFEDLWGLAAIAATVLFAVGRVRHC